MGSTQPPKEISTRNLPGAKEWPARKAHNLTAIFEPMFKKVWEPRCLTSYEPSRPVTGITLPFFIYFHASRLNRTETIWFYTLSNLLELNPYFRKAFFNNTVGSKFLFKSLHLTRRDEVCPYAQPERNLHFFLYLVCEAIGTAATPGLLCQPRVVVTMIVEKQKDCRLAGETEVLGENLTQSHFCPSQNPTWPDPGLNPGRRGGKPATNRLSYGVA
jgi:hypothetical protein